MPFYLVSNFYFLRTFKRKKASVEMVHWNNCFSNANLSLCGCGFLCIYHAGVCAALREYAPQLTRNRIYGASAGSIAAAGLICNVSVAEATTAILQVVAEARSGVLQAFSPTFDLLGIVREGLDQILPDNAHLLCTNRLFISLTRYEDGKNVIVSEYANKKELIQAILCSCFIPIFCGYSIPEFRGVRYVDGGFSDNQPVFDKNTITISPFAGESDICPMDHASASIIGFVYYNTSIRFNNENFYRFCSCFVPPSQEICSKICRQGFTDALRFLTRNSITPCTKCLSAQQSTESLIELKQSRSYLSIQTSTASPIKRRKKLNSECDVCLARLEQRLSTDMTTALFPEVLHKTLQEPVSCSNLTTQVIRYARSFRLVQFGLRLLSPFIGTFEYATCVLKMLNDWLLKTPKKDFFVIRMQKFVDFLLQEIEERNLLCSPNISCQFASCRAKELPECSALIGDFDSFESLKNRSVLNDMILVDYYTVQFSVQNKREEFIEQLRSSQQRELAIKLTNVIGEDNLSPLRARRDMDSGISSGISSSTPAVFSGVSSDDGSQTVKKRDVALSPVRVLSGMSTRLKYPSSFNRRHTVGVNSLTSTEDDGTYSAARRRLTQVATSSSLNSKPLLGSKKHRIPIHTSSSESSCSGGEEGFFVANNPASRQRRGSEGGYDGDPSSDT